MPETMWMVRAGPGGHLFDEFVRGFVGIGWEELGDLALVPYTEDEIRELYSKTYPDERGERAAHNASMIHQFRSVLTIGDKVVTYNPVTREYLIGTIESGYVFRPGEITGCPHMREVKWEGTISRNALSASSREGLRSGASLFQIEGDISKELLSLLAGEPILTPVEIAQQQMAEKEIQRRRKSQGWVTIGFGVFILALGVFFYIYTAGQIDWLREIKETEQLETITVFFWLGKEISENSPEYDEAVDMLTWLKGVGLGAAIVGAIMITLGAIRVAFPRSKKLRRFI
ncbi:MAG: hypothetical protein R6U37_02885 [Dehalococcoidia bacterium]